MTDWPSVIVGGVIGGGIGAVATALTLPHLRRQASETAAANDITLEQSDLEHAARLRDLHDRYEPQVPAEIVASVEPGQSNTFSLVGRLTLAGQTTYRVDGEALFKSGGSTPLSLPFLLRPGTERIHIEHWSPGQERPNVEAIRIRFWAPVDGDDADVWECPCGKPTAETAQDGGHWTRPIKVVFDPPPKPATARTEPPSAESRRRFFRPNKRLDL